MSTWLLNRPLLIKLRLFAVLAALGALLIAADLLLRNYDAMRAGREQATRQSVQIAHGVLAAAYALEQSGKLDRQAAQEQAIAQIKQLRYNRDDYFWINDMHPTMVMHPTNAKLDGKDLSQNKDPDGKRLFVAMVEQVKQNGEGFVAYKWPKPGAQEPVEKLSFVKGFAPWGWVIGTGIYIDDLREAFLESLYKSAGVALAVVIGMWWVVGLLARSITQRLTQAVQAAQAIAGGDLSKDFNVQGTDEVGTLLGALVAMKHSLTDIIERVQSAADSIRVAAAEVAAGNQDLSARTEQTAANLQATAASVEQITATIRQSAEQTREAGGLAQSASEQANRGGAVVTQVAQTMHGISEASKKIAAATDVINGIAFQTNILALNAAVEAARAGDQGRGFAVVASEVRTLAQRSATAAREIEALIAESTAKVAEGSEFVAQARQTMDGAVSASQQVAQVIGAMATSVAEQRAGIEQVNGAVSDLDQATQQNAALVEQSAAAASAMSEQTDNLIAAVGAFRL